MYDNTNLWLKLIHHKMCLGAFLLSLTTYLQSAVRKMRGKLLSGYVVVVVVVVVVAGGGSGGCGVGGGGHGGGCRWWWWWWWWLL